MIERILEALWQTLVIDVAEFEVWLWTSLGGFIVEAAAALLFGVALAYALFGRSGYRERRVR